MNEWPLVESLHVTEYMYRTVVILYNATTLMKKSTLIVLDQSTRNKIFLEFLGDYNGVCLKNFQRKEQKLENAFLAKFFILLNIS